MAWVECQRGGISRGSERRHLLDDVPLDLDQIAAGLEAVAADVEREIVGVDDDLEVVEPLGDEVLAELGRDEDAADEHADGPELEVGLVVKVVGDGRGHVDERAEAGPAGLALEVRPEERVLLVLGERAVEGLVLVVGHILGLAHPQRLDVVDALPLGPRDFARLRHRRSGLVVVVAGVVVLGRWLDVVRITLLDVLADRRLDVEEDGRGGRELRVRGDQGA